jgi:uncharacterized OB-fold protein
MALTTCPDCGKSVSTSAVACPGCGAPVAIAAEARAAGTPLTTTQLTSKKFKAQKLISVSMFLIGIIWLFGAISEEPVEDSAVMIPAWMVLIGLVWYIIVRFRSWWHHG